MKGFTLIEVLVTALIVGIVGLGSIFAVVNSQKIVNKQTIQVFITSNVQRLMYEIARDVRKASILENSEEGLIVKYNDGTINTWKFSDNKLYRNGVIKKVITNDKYKIYGRFTTEISSKYYSVTITMSLALEDGTRKDVINTFYCRIDPESYKIEGVKNEK